jgi:hypothetical protein
VERDARRQIDRQMAIDAGKCTNFWKCTNPASRSGGLCVACFQEYMEKHVASPVQSPVTSPVVSVPVVEPMDFPLNPEQLHIAVDAGKCTNFWMCTNPAQSQGEACVECISKRQIAIVAGKCTNFWKCTNPAVRFGGMCVTCFQEYCEQCANRATHRQIAINAGKCTNFWKCTNPAARFGGMCVTCFQEYRKKRVAFPPVASPDASPVPVVEPMNFPPLSSAKAGPHVALHVWGPDRYTEAVKAMVTAPPPLGAEPAPMMMPVIGAEDVPVRRSDEGDVNEEGVDNGAEEDEEDAY